MNDALMENILTEVGCNGAEAFGLFTFPYNACIHPCMMRSIIVVGVDFGMGQLGHVSQ